MIRPPRRALKLRESIPFGIERKMISSITSKSWREAPHVSFIYEADVTAFLEEFGKLKAARMQAAGRPMSLNTLLLRVVVEAVRAAPRLNAHIEFHRHRVSGRLNVIEDINISSPMILPDGRMMTLNLRDFGNKSLDEMTASIEDLQHRQAAANLDLALMDVSLRDTWEQVFRGRILTALGRLWGAYIGRDRLRPFSRAEKRAHQREAPGDRLGPEFLEEGTITVSNMGAMTRGISGCVGLLELVPPQVFALGIAALQEKPLAVAAPGGGSRVEVRQVLPFCLVFDHRALDFGDVVPFIRRLDEVFGKPEIIQGW
ncbi:MAG: 2-oxo acid dehydrogenase subunit E2 [Treponema sp.]|nr:2-oxo acid dehydrogenase subunit E2 [Treponema sp.]